MKSAQTKSTKNTKRIVSKPKDIGKEIQLEKVIISTKSFINKN